MTFKNWVLSIVGVAVVVYMVASTWWALRQEDKGKDKNIKP